jgi:hypothetical protein
MRDEDGLHITPTPDKLRQRNENTAPSFRAGTTAHTLQRDVDYYAPRGAVLLLHCEQGVSIDRQQII